MKRSRWRARGEGVYPRMSHHCLGKDVMRYEKGSRSSQSDFGGGALAFAVIALLTLPALGAAQLYRGRERELDLPWW
ncbi:MAG: hypothetical protein CM1200mP14_12730 [Gammaproteobacteria bacterium]|nr:MAG: hypothetical protein CM1200mP14_12730 [Gammaproteobacteria bacterium]